MAATDFATWRHVQTQHKTLTNPWTGRYPNPSAPTTMFLLARSFLICVLTIGLYSNALAQVVVDHWSTDNGLPLNSVASLCQTPEGYLWLITPDGLARFDGVRFTTFDKSNTEGIEGNRFCCGYCAPDGGFWAASESSGVTRFDHGKFRTYTVRDGLPSNSINGMTGDSAGNVWILSLGLISRWDPAARRFMLLDHSGDRYDTELGSAGKGFYAIKGNELRVFVHGKKNVYRLPDAVAQNQPIWVATDLNEQVWLASGSRVIRFVDGEPSDVRISANHPRRFHSDYRDSQGRSWRVELEWNVYGNYLQSILLPANMHSRIQARTLFEDREGGLWVGTDGQGLYRLRRPMITVRSTEEGLAGKNVYAILQTRDRAIWIGTWAGGLSRFQDGKFTTYSAAHGLASDRVYSIGEDAGGALWVSVSDGLYHRKNDRFVKVSVPVMNSGDQTIRAIYTDPQGVMWFGTNQGLLRFDHETWKMLTTADGLAGNDVRVIIPAREGGLWLGGYGGLARLKDGRLRAWTQENGLPANTVRSLYEDADGVLWVGTYDSGLGRFANGRFTRFNTSDGLFSDGVFQILEDSSANLWMSSNRGIYRVAKRQLTDFAAGKLRNINSVAYGRQDGLRNVECNGGLWPAGIRAQDGTLWFPTQDGVAVIDSKNLPAAPKPPPVIIESSLIDHAPGGSERPLRVAPGYGNLEIQYTAPSLVNSEHILFRYQMLGLDPEWVAAGTRRTAYYPHLPPGSYTFRVTAAHSDGLWNDTPVSLAIAVLPAFYQTWWFDGLLLAAAIIVMSLGWLYRIRQLQGDALVQHNFTRRLIDSQENERKRIAAELHDSLGQRLVIIKNRALLLLQPRGGAPALHHGQREQLEEISAQTSEAVREVREITYGLRPYRLDRLGLTATLRAMIEAASASASTAFSCEIDEIDGVLHSQEEISLYRIIQECVNNVLKHSRAAEAFVRIRHVERRLEVTVRDNGCGFVLKAAKNDPLGGFGLTGIAERAQLLGGKASIHSTPGRGTTVIIEVPSGK